mmetsp:Transcript_29285/g.74490  ORF Transcript_29285/g.74490 Transcript_29285/m.74490 type:complete len:215 (-) Transcript_29285:137-781(-)
MRATLMFSAMWLKQVRGAWPVAAYLTYKSLFSLSTKWPTFSSNVTVSESSRGCWPICTRLAKRSSLLVMLKLPARRRLLVIQLLSRSTGWQRSMLLSLSVPYRTWARKSSPAKGTFSLIHPGSMRPAEEPSLVSRRASAGARCSLSAPIRWTRSKTSLIGSLSMDFSQCMYLVPGLTSSLTFATPQPSCPRLRCFSIMRYMRFTPKKCVPYFSS